MSWGPRTLRATGWCAPSAESLPCGQAAASATDPPWPRLQWHRPEDWRWQGRISTAASWHHACLPHLIAWVGFHKPLAPGSETSCVRLPANKLTGPLQNYPSHTSRALPCPQEKRAHISLKKLTRVKCKPLHMAQYQCNAGWRMECWRAAFRRTWGSIGGCKAGCESVPSTASLSPPWAGKEFCPTAVLS